MLVAKEITMDKRDDLFAATPLLEALELLLSMAMTERVGYEQGKEKAGVKLEFIYNKRAHLQATARRDIYVQHPEEDATPGMCAKLGKAMYGTRDAAHNWEWAYRIAHKDWGFTVGKSSPCVSIIPK